MKAAWFELRLIMRSRLAVGALCALLVLASLSVWNGMAAMGAQQDALARITAAHQEDFAGVAKQYGARGDAGYAAYYTFHLTWDEPPPLAFVAIGQRDLQPYSLRVRMLGLHSQLYESETFNPELALAGRFDFAFVLIYLVPLFVIILLHDLLTGERETGRLTLLMSLPAQHRLLWWRRAGLRYALMLAAILLPLLIGAVLSGAPPLHAAGMAGIAVLITAFWIGLALVVGALSQSSARSAAVLLAWFVVLTMLLPALANSVITRLVPVGKGVELAMVQREAVHQGWDLPRADVMNRFFVHHPEWSATPPVTGRFHWKWYYAMHQVGDETVAGQAGQYRHSLQQREAWARQAGWLLPAAAAQAALHRLAGTDLQAQFAYLDQVAAYHAELRHFFYPFLFNEQRFGEQEYKEIPTFQAIRPGGSFPVGSFAALAMAVLGIAAAASVTVARAGSRGES